MSYKLSDLKSFSELNLNGYLMRASDLDKRDGVADDDGSGGCSNVDRLVGVMQLDAPVVISPSTISFKFTFALTCAFTLTCTLAYTLAFTFTSTFTFTFTFTN